MAQDNQSKQSLKLDIFVENVINPYEFQFRRATSEQSQQAKLNGSMLDISPVELAYDRMCMLDNVIALEWTRDAVETFKNLVMSRKLAFDIQTIKNGICSGKLYIKLSNGEKDVSEIMVEMGKAHNSNSINQLLNAAESIDTKNVEVVTNVRQNENEMVQLSVPEQNSQIEHDSSSSVTLVSIQTVEKLKTRTSDGSDDSDWESKLMSACSDDSTKTEEIGEAATFVPSNHSADQSIPAYLLEDDISEIGAEKYSIPRNSDLFRELETGEMKELLKGAKQMDNTFKLLCITLTQLPRLMFHPRVNRYLKQVGLTSNTLYHIQEQMWSFISEAIFKKFHIVGDTHYIMYLPPICDSIYRQKGVPLKGPEALIVVSNTNKAKEIEKFCAIILGKNAVHLDLNTPSDKLSIKDPKIKKCAIVIVRLNRLANLMAIGEFNNCKYIVIDGVHRLWENERDSLAEWLNQTRESISQILTSNYYVKAFEKNSALLACQSFIDGAVIAGIQFILHPFTETNLFHNIGPCAIVSTNDKSKKDLSDSLRKSLPKATFNRISFYTDQECVKKGNFTVLVHNGLPKSFKLFEQRFVISVGIFDKRPIAGTNKLAKSIILLNNEENTLTTKQKQILEILRDRNLLSDPLPKQSLLKSLRNRLKTECMKIEIVAVLTPENYKIRWEANDEAIVRLSDISPKLKYGWDSMDSNRVRGLLFSNPFSDQQIEAYIYFDGEQIFVEDMLICENGKMTNLKNWLREQEIIR